MNRLIIVLTLLFSVNAFAQNENDSLKITQLIIDDDGKIYEKNWSESIICKKINGLWKISLIHSTPIRKEH